ncbi:MAG TPA: hypothetical protein VIP11_16830 [Gemmatimonadaceae bacterium]
MAHTQHTHQETDAKAAFTGLIVGAIVLFVIVRGIVYLTNAHYAGEKSHVESTK